jgi:hypothetical protein
VEDHVNRAPGVGLHRSFNLRIGRALQICGVSIRFRTVAETVRSRSERALGLPPFCDGCQFHWAGPVGQPSPATTAVWLPRATYLMSWQWAVASIMSVGDHASGDIDHLRQAWRWQTRIQDADSEKLHRRNLPREFTLLSRHPRRSALAESVRDHFPCPPPRPRARSAVLRTVVSFARAESRGFK